MNNTIRTRLWGVIAAVALLPGCAYGSTITSEQAGNALINKTEAGDYWHPQGIFLTPSSNPQTWTALFEADKPGGMTKECRETWSQAWHSPSENEKVYAATMFEGSSRSGVYLEVLIRDSKSKDFSTGSFKKLRKSCAGDYSLAEGTLLAIEKLQVTAGVKDVENLNMYLYPPKEKAFIMSMNSPTEKNVLSKMKVHAIRGNVRRVTFQIICVSEDDVTICPAELRRLIPMLKNKIEDAR